MSEPQKFNQTQLLPKKVKFFLCRDEDFSDEYVITQGLHDALQMPELKEVFSSWGYESELEQLERSINMIKLILDRVPKKSQAKDQPICLGLMHDFCAVYEKLVYFISLAKRNSDLSFTPFHYAPRSHVFDNKLDTIVIHNQNEFGLGKTTLTRVVYHDLKTRMNKTTLAWLGYQELEKLSLRIKQHEHFDFKLYRHCVERTREDNCPDVYANNIFWIEDDRQKIVNNLLDANVGEHVCFVGIIGIGGLGITTLVASTGGLGNMGKSRLLDANIGIHVCFVSTGVGGLGKTAFGLVGGIGRAPLASNMCQSQALETSSPWIKQQSECKENSFLLNSQPISGNWKAGDLWGGSEEGDKEQNAGITLTGDEDKKSDYNSSAFTFIQLFTLAISILLLCFLPLCPKYVSINITYKEEDDYKAITTVALIAAALASRISLETIPRRPQFARPCGLLAIFSLLAPLASFLPGSLPPLLG